MNFGPDSRRPPSAPVVIAGGGISGLSAAYFLRKRGIPTVLIEPSPHLGGLLRTERFADCTIECGADSWLAAKPWASQLAAQLGLSSEVVGSQDQNRGVAVLRRGRLVPYPREMQLIVPRRISTVWTSSLLPFQTKLRMSADWLRSDSGERPDRSVAEFVRDHFGQGAVDYLAEPLLSGIYGGDTEHLSAAAVLPKFVAREKLHGSITRAVLETPAAGSVFASLRDGLGQLPAALAPEHLLRGEAEALRRNAAAWQVRVNGDWLEASHVILATPAHAAAPLAGGSLGALLGTIEHSSAHIVAMAFRNLHPLSGFGLLVPKKEGHDLMAATWVTNKFASRAPEGVQLVRAFFRQPPPDPVRSLQQISGIRTQPFFVREYRWPRSLPQYAVGHTALIARIEAEVDRLPGLHLAGNAYHGVGIPDCIRLAEVVAARVEAAVCGGSMKA